VLAALLTGRVNPFVQVETTLVEALARGGRTTHAVLPREVLRWAGKTLLTRGMTSYDRLITDPGARDVGDRASGHETTALGLAFLERYFGPASSPAGAADAGAASAGGASEASAGDAGTDEGAAMQDATRPPMFLWLHYFDVHEHHQLKASDRRLRAALDAHAADPGTATMSEARTRYRATVKLVDDEIGRVVAALKARGLWERTVVVLVSDHGESLGEDPRLPDAHGRFLYQPLIHVPLLIRVPGVSSATSEVPTTLIDVTATILDLAGVRSPDTVDGITLVPQLGPPPPPALRERPAPIALYESDQAGVIAWPHKLLYRPGENLTEVYDLQADPDEIRDLSAAEPALTRRLKAIFQSLPRVSVDRTRAGREARETLAQPPTPPVTPAPPR
jgi:arylsulfatase A-like enzyme